MSSRPGSQRKRLIAYIINCKHKMQKRNKHVFLVQFFVPDCLSLDISSGTLPISGHIYNTSISLGIWTSSSSLRKTQEEISI